ncbi:MAG: hypothetical protein WBP94_18295 [Rhodomicrobiaceae bacterium]
MRHTLCCGLGTAFIAVMTTAEAVEVGCCKPLKGEQLIRAEAALDREIAAWCLVRADGTQCEAEEPQDGLRR